MPSDDPNVISALDQRMERKTNDALLTVEALDKVVGLMREGRISPRLSIMRYPLQIVLQSEVGEYKRPFDQADLAVIEEVFGAGTQRVKLRAVHSERDRRRHTSRIYDSATRTYPLRPVNLDAPKWRPDVQPRVEVWGIFVPHECSDFTGYTDPSGKPRWRCGHHGCRKVLGIRAARERGLTP